jgi:hypothetical protein
MLPEKDESNLFLKTLIWICTHFKALHIDYMITGGSALGFWGHIRTTMDVDIVIHIREHQITPLLEALQKEAYVDMVHAKNAFSTHTMFNILHKKTFFKIDLIPLKEDPYEMEKFNNKKEIFYENLNLFVISPEDLILSKLQWNRSIGGSERQMKDCESLYRLNQNNLNFPYLKKWVSCLHLEDSFHNICS